MLHLLLGLLVLAPFTAAVGGATASSAAAPAILHVNASSTCSHPDGSTGCPYPTIQQGVSAANAGDWVLVAPGEYGGSVDVTIANLTLRAQGNVRVAVGGDAASITVDRNATNVTVQGFRFVGANVTNHPQPNWTALEVRGDGARVVGDRFEGLVTGLVVRQAAGTVVRNDTFVGNGISVYLYQARNATVAGSRVVGATEVQPDQEVFGIRLEGVANTRVVNDTVEASKEGTALEVAGFHDEPSGHNIVQGNRLVGEVRVVWSAHDRVEQNVVHGYITVTGTSGILLANDTVEGSFYHAIHVAGDPDPTIVGNHVRNGSREGIRVDGASAGLVANNSLAHLRWDGLFLNDTAGTQARGNRIVDARVGITLENATHDVVRENVVLDARLAAVRVAWGSRGNLLADNLLRSATSVVLGDGSGFPNLSEPGPNAWNLTPRDGENIAGGHRLGGNAYLGGNGTGTSRTCKDADHDGLCDDPRVFGPGNADQHPIAIAPAEDLSVTNGQVLPGTVGPGERSQVRLELGNHGNHTLDVQANLLGFAPDPRVQNVSIAPGDHRVLTWTIVGQEPGVHPVRVLLSVGPWNDHRTVTVGELRVRSPPQRSPAPGFPVLAGAALVAAFVLHRRRR